MLFWGGKWKGIDWEREELFVNALVLIDGYGIYDSEAYINV